jgi:SAM-dependent methyltransferase
LAETARIADGYDALSSDYDRMLVRDQWMRRALWRHFDRLFRAGDRILDVGCGTGLDTLHLASRGARMTAVDISPGMVAQLRAKLLGTSLAPTVDVRTGDIARVLGELSGPFDGIVSSFAALNTIDLAPFAREAARLIRPGGRVVAHVLGPGYRAGRAQRWWLAVRRGARVVDVDVHGCRIPHALLTARELHRRFFADAFAYREGYALGLLVGRRAELRMPETVLDAAARLESCVSRAWPLTSAGRFYVLDVERRSERSCSPLGAEV